MGAGCWDSILRCSLIHAQQAPSGVLYRLDAIIVHLGAPGSGHFLTVRRVPMSAEPAFKSWITGGPPYVSAVQCPAHTHTHHRHSKAFDTLRTHVHRALG